MQFSLISILSLAAIASAGVIPRQGPPTPPTDRCTAANEGQACDSGEINGFFLSGTCTAFPIRHDMEQYACIPLGTLLDPVDNP